MAAGYAPVFFHQPNKLIMNNPHYSQPPVVNLDNLDEHYEIVIDYDANGNMTRIRKVRRYEGCGLWVSLLSILVLSVLAWLFL